MNQEARKTGKDEAGSWRRPSEQPIRTTSPRSFTFSPGTSLAEKARVTMRKFDPRPEGVQPHVNTLELKAILVVDDDQQLASALQWILADENFLVDVAFDGEQALLKVKAHEYDAVICDLKMPKLRGDEFYLKAKELRPSLADRFIFITGFAADPNIALFFAQNEVKYLVKPFGILGLINCVKQLIC
jgi:CheY-like chemotaxis protein